MAENQYLYAVARIRSREQFLLPAAFFEQLVSAPDYQSCIKMLREKGWGTSDTDSSEQMLAGERKKTWSLMEELVKDLSVFDVFLYGNDYHNLKAAVKECRHPNEFSNLFISQGTVPVETIRKALLENDYSELPEAMRKPAGEARQILLHTGDGQLCDIIIDRASLEAIYRAGKDSGNEFLKLYGELTVACADIKTAVRASLTGKDKDFLERALVPCESLDLEKLTEASLSGRDAVADYLEKTEYQNGADELRDSLSAFERWCDNLMMRKIKPQLYNPFGIGPLAAYILARESEIKSVRIVLSGKWNQLPEDMIRERMRETYV